MGRIGFNLLPITFEMILCIELQKDIGMNFPCVSASSELGIRVKNVTLKDLKTP